MISQDIGQPANIDPLVSKGLGQAHPHDGIKTERPLVAHEERMKAEWAKVWEDVAAGHL